MFTDTLNKVTQGFISHSSLRMIPSLSLTLKGKDSTSKFKERGDESPGYRNLLLLMVRLIHADPMLMLNVSFIFFEKGIKRLMKFFEAKLFRQRRCVLSSAIICIKQFFCL